MNLFSKTLCVLALGISSAQASAPTGELPFNSDWKFTLSDKPEFTFTNYETTDEWREVDLPHDWSVEHPFTDDLTKGDGATGYLPGGIAWYSKSFEKPITKDQKCYLIFDGVYNNSEYWINGKKLGDHPYGYSPFFFDITDYLKPVGQSNELMVRVDRSRFVDSRWYTGSGIYRDVNLLVVDKLHIPVWGTYLTTPYVSPERATVSLKVDIENDYEQTKSGVIITDIIAPQGGVVASLTTSFELDGDSRECIEQILEVPSPELWGLDDPNLYYAKSRVVSQGELLEERETRFGIRTIKFDAQKGFFLNGENMKIKGVCLHHDGGLVGAAVPKAVWERRLRILKEGGCNAIRSSHNPCSEEFLDLCDEMGILVQQEFFDEWDAPKDKRQNMYERTIDYESRGYARFFQEWAEKDLKNVMLRDRNRPSIFQWSIGNEIEWTYEGNRESTGFFGADANGNYFWNQPPYGPERIKAEWRKQPEHTYDIGRTARKLAKWTREMDLTRPVIANCILPSISYETGYIDALDIAGFSYRRVMYDYGYEHYPEKPMMGTENVGQWHEWKAVLDRDYISGIFIWTGIDYMGERGGKRLSWPEKSTTSGLLDIAGFEKPSFRMMKSLWVDEPYIAIYSQSAEKSVYKEDENGVFGDKNPKSPWSQRLWVWNDVNEHWNYANGENVVVELYSNCEQIELLQNGKSLGVKSLADFEDHIYKWSVDFAEGKIEARGVKDGESTKVALESAGEPVGVKLVVDRDSMAANGKDAVHVVAQLVDKKGRSVSYTDKIVEFSIEGECRVLGVDNGHAANIMPFQATNVKTSQGRCLMILQSEDVASTISVSAVAEGLTSNEISIVVE